MNTKSLLAMLAVLVVAASAYLYVNPPGSQQTVRNTDSTSVSGMRAEENGLVVVEQRPGSSVKAALVFAASPGFLVVHEDNAGASGAIIGSSVLLQSGETRDVAVQLTRASTDGEMLRAMLHTDVDGNGIFNPAIDLPVQSILGGPIHGTFYIDADAQDVGEITI